MKKILPLIFFIVYVTQMQAQESKYQVNISANTYTHIVELSKDGELKIAGTAPDKIQIQFPDKDFEKYTIQINKGKNAEDSAKIIYVTYKCSADMKICSSFNISDLQNGVLTLDLKNNSLYKVGSIEAGMKAINRDTFYLRVTKEAAKPEEKKVDPKTLEVNSENIKPDNYFKIVNPSRPNLSPLNYWAILGRLIDSSSAKYILINDNRPNAAPYTILKRNSCSNKYELKQKVNLLEGQTINHIVISKQDTSFTLETNTETYFMEGKDAFKTAVDGLITPPETVPAQSQSKSEAAKNLTGEQVNQMHGMFMGLDQEAKQIFTYGDVLEAISMAQKQADEDQANIKKADLDNTALKKQLEDIKAKLTNARGADSAKLAAKASELQQKISANDSTIAALKTHKDSLDAIIKSLTKVIAPANISFKEELLSLDAALSNFNSHYRNIDLREDDYQNDLKDLSANIVKLLKVGFGSNADLLEKNLKFRINTEVLPEYRADLLGLVDGIKAKYTDAKSKTSLYKVFQQPVDVPNADLLTLKLTNHESHTVFEKKYNVIGGMRIDFSAGIAINGLADPEFYLKQETYHYKDLVQTVDTPANVVHNTYTTQIKDTTGYVIGHDHPHFSYGAVLLMHTYWKVSPVVNPALTVGLSFDNEKKIKIPFGASILFNAKGVRFGITAGGIVGTEKTLSSKQVESNTAISTSQPIEKSEIPVLYSGDTEIKTYNKWTVRWMLALHFNFGTVNPK